MLVGSLALAMGCESANLSEAAGDVTAAAAATKPAQARGSEPLGPCIQDVVGHAGAHAPAAFEGASDVPLELRGTPLADVDGDGTQETMLTATGWCGPGGNCPHMLYLSGSVCPTLAGSLWAQGKSVNVLPTRHHGRFDLERYVAHGCAGTWGEVQTLQWTGSEYTVASGVTCACMWQDRPTRDPRCPS